MQVKEGLTIIPYKNRLEYTENSKLQYLIYKQALLIPYPPDGGWYFSEEGGYTRDNLEVVNTVEGGGTNAMKVVTIGNVRKTTD